MLRSRTDRRFVQDSRLLETIETWFVACGTTAGHRSNLEQTQPRSGSWSAGAAAAEVAVVVVVGVSAAAADVALSEPGGSTWIRRRSGLGALLRCQRRIRTWK